MGGALAYILTPTCLAYLLWLLLIIFLTVCRFYIVNYILYVDFLLSIIFIKHLFTSPKLSIFLGEGVCRAGSGRPAKRALSKATWPKRDRQIFRRELE